MTTLILSPVLALTLVSARSPSVTPAASTRPARVRSRPFAVAKPDLSDAATRRPRRRRRPGAPPAPAPTKPAREGRPCRRPPVVAAPPADPNSVIGIIEAAAARWGVSGGWMVKIARCESGLRPTAYNPQRPVHRPLPVPAVDVQRTTAGTNIYDAADQANIAAKMLAHGQAHQWSCA